MRLSFDKMNDSHEIVFRLANGKYSVEQIRKTALTEIFGQAEERKDRKTEKVESIK